MNLIKQIEEAGIENCMFLVPMKPVNTYFGIISFTSSNDPDFIVPAKIDESRYKIAENYKITLRSTYEKFGKEHFYISDLESMTESGTIEFFIKPKLS